MKRDELSPTQVEVRKFINECRRLWPGARVPPSTKWRLIAESCDRRHEERLCEARELTRRSWEADQ